MNRDDLIWLAGWLEGEGCFYYCEHNKNSPRVIIQGLSTDLDVVQRVARLLGNRNISMMPTPRTGCKQCYRTEVQSDAAAALMAELLPLMGIRRSEKIRECIEKWENRPNKPIHKLCACGCGKEVFGGMRVLYANRETGACAMRAFRARQKEVA